MGIANLDALDEQILKLIADNARIPFWKWLVLVMYLVPLFISAYRS